MAQERAILDPTEKTEGTRVELDITPWIDVEGIDWGDAEMEAYKAEAQLGESVVDFRLPNRAITMPLVIKSVGGTSFAKARSYIQAKAAHWQREGGILKRILATGGTVYCDIVANGLTLSGDWRQANREVDTEAELRLEAIPDFYEPEVELTSGEEKTAAELIKVIPDPGGDMPARVRIVVEEKQGAEQRGLIWSLRSRHYSSASTAKTAYDAEELQVLDAARKVSLFGASGETVVQHGTVSTNWTGVVGGRLGGTAWPTHTGTNRVFARLHSTYGTLTHARLVWDVGDLVNPVENEGYQLPGANNFYIADLGEVRLDKAPIGTHRWDWQIQARGEQGNEDFAVDKVWIVNVDEGMGRLTAPVSFAPGGFTGFSARDEFNQSVGSLTGKVLVTGGTWAGAGDAVDFSLNTTSHAAQRKEVSDAAGVAGGHFALAGTATFTNIAVRCEFMVNTPNDEGLSIGPVARYSNTKKYVTAYRLEIEDIPTLAIVKVLEAGFGEVIAFQNWPVGLGREGTWYWITLAALSSGEVFATAGSQGSTRPRVTVSGLDAGLATGGTWASGRIGFFDQSITSNPITREVDNFAAWVPTRDAVAFASRSAQLTTDGMYRLDSGGSAYGPISRVIGGLPRLPAGGLENRPSELFLKASRGDIGELPDSAIDDLGVKAFARRSWLTVPGTI